MPLDPDLFGTALAIEVGVYDALDLAARKHLLMGAVLAMQMAGRVAMMRDLIAMAADQLLALHPVGRAVGAVGGDDTIGVIDEYGRVFVHVDQGLHGFVEAGC